MNKKLLFALKNFLYLYKLKKKFILIPFNRTNFYLSGYLFKNNFCIYYYIINVKYKRKKYQFIKILFDIKGDNETNINHPLFY